MFGLRDEKKKPGDEFHFELENELKDPKKHKELKAKVEDRIQEIKSLLRGGEKQKNFEDMALILHGYQALLKVFARFEGKK